MLEIITVGDIHEKLNELAMQYIKDNKGVTVCEAFLWAKENFSKYYVVWR